MIKELKYDKQNISWIYNEKPKSLNIKNIWCVKYSKCQDLIAVEYNQNHKVCIKIFSPDGKLIENFVSILGRKIIGLAKFNENEKIQIKITYENGITYLCEYSKFFNTLEKIKKI